MGIFSKLFDSNVREVTRLVPFVEKINLFEVEAKKLKKSEFPAKTASFRQRLNDGETLDDLMPEALAVGREAVRRVIGERAFDVQLMASIVLHQGKVAEQKTGEGKTLASALTAYLDALSGKGVHIVTVNDYLARRDTGWYGQALYFLGLTVGCIVHEESFVLDLEYQAGDLADDRLRHLKPVGRKEAYAADVTYGTNNEFGFDYLRDNMARSLEEMVQRPHAFAIVDEVDFVLIDEARTPLIISAPDTEPTEKYYRAAQLISILSPDTDYEMDEKHKTATLTEHGVRKVEKKLGVDNLYEKDFDTIHHIENALRARVLYRKDTDYIVKDGQVIIVDEFTGRLMHGRRWGDGLHQAVEAKEGVKIERESKTLATISFQNYFRMYEKLAGMTGTAATEAEELEKIYRLSTVVIPTNRPVVRRDAPDAVYKTSRAKFDAVVAEVAQNYQKGQPVLVGTTSIEKNEIISKFLKKKKIPHQVLNAKNHEKEAQIIADAGRKKAVTVATNMAGRGVDIVLGGAKPKDQTKTAMKEWQEAHDEVVELGGLHVIGTERHESRRIDNQLRGRSGRQGDPGSSRFYVALNDEIMRLFGGERIAKMMTALNMPEDQPVEHAMVSRAIESAQSRVESFHFDMRKQVVDYDDVMNRQRQIIYERRFKILNGGGQIKETILARIDREVADLVAMYAPEGIVVREAEKIIAGFCEILPLDSGSQEKIKNILTKATPAKAKEVLLKTVGSAYESREKQIGPDQMHQLERALSLMTIDRLWMEHLETMKSLREGIGLRGYAQQDPLVEYKKEAYQAFEGLLSLTELGIAKRIFRVQFRAMPTGVNPGQVTEGRENMVTPKEPSPVSAPKLSLAQNRAQVPSGDNKVGRNDPCPCGAVNPNTGKVYKYKKCGLIGADWHRG